MARRIVRTAAAVRSAPEQPLIEGEAGPVEMARVFVGLKLRLVSNLIGRQRGRVIGLIIYLLATIGGGLAIATVLTTAQWTPEQTVMAAPFATAVLAIAWIVMPVAFTGVDSTLDPTRLAPFPLSAGSAIPGLALSALIGGAPVMTLFVLVGVATHAGSIIGILLGVLAAFFQVVLCVLLSRAITTGLAGLLRSRRTRDLSFTIMAILAGVGGFAGQMSEQIFNAFTWARITSVASVTRWTPLSLAGRVVAESSSGNLIGAFAALLVLIAAVAAVGWLWWRLLDRALRTAFEASEVDEQYGRGGLAPNWAARFLPDSALGAVTAKELRYLWRHPRARADMITSTIFFAVMFVPLQALVFSGDPRAVLLASAAGAMLGLAALNMLAIDGRGSWFDSLATDYDIVLAGKALARAVISVPIVLGAAVFLAIINGGWAYVPVTPFLGAGLLGVHLGVGVCASVYAPVTLPDGSDTNPWNASGGTNFVAGIFSLSFFALGALLGSPLIAVVLLTMLTRPELIVVLAPFSILYGFVAWRIGLAVATSRAERKRPELIATLGY